MFKPLGIEELNQNYNEADQADQEIFAEQRSNILLVAGDHYTRQNSKYWSRIRDSRDLMSEQKLRLTKNHIQKITKTYVNEIISHSPGTFVGPNNQKELKDQKAAQLNQSVWDFAKKKHQMEKKILSEAKDFTEFGEVACKIFWDPMGGRFLNYAQNEQGEDYPLYSGDLVFERLFPFNLLRAASSKSMYESPFLCVRKMVGIKELLAKIPEGDPRRQYVHESTDRTYMVFDGSAQGYVKTSGQTMLREFYYRPSHECPNGYFYITTDLGILFNDELPFGLFPIIYEGFDEIQTSPRHRSIIKQARPYQAEINRAASKEAEHQITLGDDKLLVQSGTKVTNGGQLPGVRALQYQGMAPTILQGRSGSQYHDYVNAQIDEMYRVCNLEEIKEDKNGQYDPFGMLFLRLSQRKKFSIYAKKFEAFQVAKTQLYLELAKKYFDENQLIPMVGTNEYVNIAEFKSSDPLCYQIKIEPRVDDIETMMGKQLVMNHALQYVGNQLDKEDIGKIMRSMPLGNFEESFSDLTLKYDRGTNMILALDRGEPVILNKYDDPAYMIKRLTSRMAQSDFSMLSPQIQAQYEGTVKAYENLEAQELMKIKQAQSQFIPSGGPMVKVDFYVPSAENPKRSERATLPSEAVSWLIDQLASQGTTQEVLARLNQGAQAGIAEAFGNINQGQQMAPAGPPMPEGQGNVLPV